MAKQSALLAEDGAIFLGAIQKIEGGKFQASCHARLDLASSTLEEEPWYHTAGDYDEAYNWINDIAVKRGFPTWRDTSVSENS